LETFEKSKEELVPWIETCNHYYQNKSCEGESLSKNHWHSRHKRIRYATRTVPLECQTQHFIWTTSCEAVP